MSIFSAFKSLFVRPKHSNQTISTHTTNTVLSPVVNTLPSAVKPNTPLFDVKQVQAELDALLELSNASEKDAKLIEFATHSLSTEHRWQAVQATTPAAWQAILTHVAPRDRRISKWVKAQIANQKAQEAKENSWLDLSNRYQTLLAAPSVDVRHLVELDKAFDTAQLKHPFDSHAQALVNEWRSQLQQRLHLQNETQRTAQRLLIELKHIHDLAQSGEYHEALKTQLNTIIDTHTQLSSSHGVLAIQRLYEEINALLPKVSAALTTAATKASQLDEVNRLVAKAQQLAQQPQNAVKSTDIAELKRAWRHEFDTYLSHKNTFETTLNQLNQQLHIRQSEATKNHEKHLNWLIEKKAALATALEAGQGQVSVALFDEINTQMAEWSTVVELPHESAAELERLLAQAREIRHLLWEGAALERESIIRKLQSLADKPLVGKFQEAAFKEAIEAWKAVNTKAGNAPSPVYIQFKAASDAAYAPIKLYKDNMRQVNTVGNEQREHLLIELSKIQADIDWNTVDWRKVDDLRKEARKQWRECLPASYKHRESLYERFDTIMQLFEEKLSQARATELARREALTQAAKQLEGQPFAEQHTQARALMTRYTVERIPVFVPRDLEQLSWANFRAAIDAVYSRRETERQAEMATNIQAINELIHSKQTILTALNHANVATSEYLANENGLELQTLGSKYTSLQTALQQAENQWNELEPLTPNMGKITDINIDGLEQDWLNTQAVVKKTLSLLKKQIKQSRINTALNLAKALDEGVDSAQLFSLWQSAHQDNLIKQAFIERITAVKNNAYADFVQLHTTDTQHQALLNAEIANHVDSPAAYKAARLALQVQNLSEKMTGIKQQSTDAGLTAWLNALALPNSTQGEAEQRLTKIAEQL